METKTMFANPRTKDRGAARGFTLLEMMCATVILMVALFAVAQLVPASIMLNSRNRNDSAALVFAQRELDQMLEQPLSAVSFTDEENNVCNLGDFTNPNAVIGNSVAVINNLATIDFSATPIPGYSLTYQDPNSPNAATLDVRWAVITSATGNNITSKRFILGVRQQGGNGYFLPVTLDSVVER